MSTYFEREIVAETELCRANGELNPDAVGWARSPVIGCNLKGRWLRKKKWNYWCVMSGECLFSATVSNIDYAGMVFVYFLDYETKKFIEKTIMTPFGGGCAMPAGVYDDVRFRNKKMEIEFLQEGADTRLRVRSDDFGGEKLDADILVRYPEGYETLNVVIPWDPRRFQFTSKHEGMSAEGTIRLGGRTYGLGSDTYGCLDFGRGIWPYKVRWNWACAGGFWNGRRIGLNLGGQWTDNTGMNENAVTVDGKISKISTDMIFEYDRSDLMMPWKIRDAKNEQVELLVVPFYERVAKSDLGVIVSEVHQMIGRFRGRVRTADGGWLEFDDLLGTIEDHLGKW
jgi:hypothetical protein